MLSKERSASLPHSTLVIPPDTRGRTPSQAEAWTPNSPRKAPEGGSERAGWAQAPSSSPPHTPGLSAHRRPASPPPHPRSRPPSASPGPARPGRSPQASRYLRLLSSGPAERWRKRGRRLAPGAAAPGSTSPPRVGLSGSACPSHRFPRLSPVPPWLAPAGDCPPPLPSSSHAGVHGLFFVPCRSGNGAARGTRVRAQGVSGGPAEIRRTHAGTQDGS